MTLSLEDFVPKDFLEKLDELHVTTGDILTRAIHNGLGKMTTTFTLGTRLPESGIFSIGEKVYVLSDHFEKSPHRYGDGGEVVSITTLKFKEIPLIFSINFEAYETYSDDSTDFVAHRVKRTYLIQEDPFARNLFDLIK